MKYTQCHAIKYQCKAIIIYKKYMVTDMTMSSQTRTRPTSMVFSVLKFKFASQSLTRGVSIATLRRAWNSFARLLNVDFEKSFLGPVYGPEPNTVVCDGTMLGYRKDLLAACSYPDPHEAVKDKPLLKGSKHSDRVLMHSSKAREL